MLPDGLSYEATGTVEVPCSEKDVSVVFHVVNKQSLERVMKRFVTLES
jgi:3-polyprenyl-4-hydroxybenzoate decarboxylase